MKSKPVPLRKKLSKNSRTIESGAMSGLQQLEVYRDPGVVYFIGTAAYPTNTAGGQVYKNTMLGLLIDVTTSQILEADINLVAGLSRRFIKAQFIGRRLLEDFELIVEDLNRYQGTAQKAVMVAARMILDHYKKYIHRDKGLPAAQLQPLPDEGGILPGQDSERV